MKDEVYRRLAKVLDILPSGWPATDSGIELKILKKIFSPEEADLFCDLKLAPESAEQIAHRTGRSVEGLEEKLVSMWKKGEIGKSALDRTLVFRMLPWVVGIYELQVDRMDSALAKMIEEYSIHHWGPQFVRHGPPLLQVVPIEKEIPVRQEALTYQQVSGLIEKAKSFMVVECICKKRQQLLGNPCTKPTEVCLAIDSSAEAFNNHPLRGRVISKEGALEVLRIAEDAGLVHLTNNVESGHNYICNCCGCCCSALRALNRGVPNQVNSHYYAAYLLREGFLELPLHMQFVMGVLGGCQATVYDLVHLKSTADRLFGGQYTWSVIGTGCPDEFRMGAVALAMGGHIRVGLEDNLLLAKGKLARSNAELVGKMRRICEDLGKEIATPQEAREMIHLKGMDKVAS